jgi:hypothetical protein
MRSERHVRCEAGYETLPSSSAVAPPGLIVDRVRRQYSVRLTVLNLSTAESGLTVSIKAGSMAKQQSALLSCPA